MAKIKLPVKQKELKLSAKSLSEEGISTKLTSNDLVEIIANDLYNKVIDSVTQTETNKDYLYKKYEDILKPEKEIFLKELKSEFNVDKKIENVLYEFQQRQYKTIEFIRESNSKSVSFSKDVESFYIPLSKEDELKITLSCSTDENVPSSSGDDTITWTKNVKTNITFKKIITVKQSPFLILSGLITEHNKNVQQIFSTLPKNKSFNIESLTREARVKLNKKILSGQSEELKTKLRTLFAISI